MKGFLLGGGAISGRSLSAVCLIAGDEYVDTHICSTPT